MKQPAQQPKSVLPANIKHILFIILLLALIRGIIYASVVPPWQAPDEPAQFERVKASLSATEWNSTIANDPAWYDDLTQSLFDFGFWDFVDGPRQMIRPDSSIRDHISLYQDVYQGLYGSRGAYITMGWPLWLAPNQDIVHQLYLARLLTAIMNVGVIYLAFLTVRTLFPNDLFLLLGVPILILFNPQHTHLMATINNGNLAELLSVAALYFMVRTLVNGYSWPNLLAVIGFTLGAMYTKATAYFLPFAIGCIALFYLWRFRRFWYWLIPAGLALAGLLYFFAPRRLSDLLVMAWANVRYGENHLDPIVPIDLFRSYWAMPGWTILQIHPLWYRLLFIGCVLALLGLVILLVQQWRLLFDARYTARVQALVLLAVAIVVAISIPLVWNMITNVIVYRQGRSIYPVTVAISLFLMLGWRQLIPKGYRSSGLLVLTSAFFLFDSLLLFHYIIPLFYSRF
ncbi:MAG: hypothetical protein KDJ65_04875 [Anaerolineae bacterium]|nr:hypothetical protein [Anaerolineae bacterium]